MATPINTITLSTSVGIYDRCAYVARIYKDKIIITTPYVKWIGNSGGYAEKKTAIRELDLIKAIETDLANDCEASAWNKIGKAIGDEYLQYSA